MRDFEALRKKARYLSTKMKTIWTSYDFTERSANPNKRVPNIEFDVPVKVDLNEVHHYKDDKEVYLREYQFQYEGETFIFELATHLIRSSVEKYWLEVYTPAGDGVGGKHFLFSEKL